MRLPLTVRWTTGAAVGETSTESRDVSSRGVYFFLSKDVKEGSPVEILLTLPNEITLAGPVRVRCLGRVQRTEPREEGAVGVVAAISAMNSFAARKKSKRISRREVAASRFTAGPIFCGSKNSAGRLAALSRPCANKSS